MYSGGGRDHSRWTMGVARIVAHHLLRGWCLSDPPEAFQGWCDHPWPSTVASRPPQWVVGQPLWGLDLLFLFPFFL
jgi:hypothetical protein